MAESKLIVGLGNPGKDYEFTRHNLGFLVIRELAKRLSVNFKLSSLTNGMTADGKVEEKEICLLLPLTYVNKSGVAVKQIVDKKNLFHKNVLIVCDDLNLNFGQIRLRAKGSDGGHNGLSSIIHSLNTEGFARLRMGIDQSPKNKDAVDYVLAEFNKKEKIHLDQFIQEATDCCLVWLREGISKSMEQYNKRK